MPELPEVETIKRDLTKGLLGKVLVDTVVYDDRVIRGARAADFSAQLKGCAVKAIARRGKAIILTLSSGKYLVVQVMMTGQLIFSADSAAMPMTKITFRLSNGVYLHYNDQRLFGRLQIVDDLMAIPYLQTIGPEPLSEDFQISWLAGKLKKRSMPIKTLLLNPQFVAGIGNIYASEILFVSKIHPRRRAGKIKAEEIKRLHRATIDVLKEAIRRRGTSMRNYRDGNGQEGGFMKRIKVYGRENEQCYHCHGPIYKIVLSGRSTFFCKKCQR
jgi:formamidopyrimidine-DNA glycosylase